MHIGNIKIDAKRDESSIADDDPALLMATSLLGVDVKEFKKWITKKQIITRSEKIVTNLNQYQAIVGRDSVAKFIYSMLFDWLVKVININLSKDEGMQAGQRFIGVLDIYGFEHFKKNSFEQFCIVSFAMSAACDNQLTLPSPIRTTRTRNCNKSSTHMCSSWNRKSMWRRRFSG